MSGSFKYWVWVKKKQFIDSAILGGVRNFVNSNYSAVVGGDRNGINTGANCSFVGGGSVNAVSGAYSSVVGGVNNQVNGTYSAILGGSGNVAGAAYSYAGIFGCNVNAVLSCAFHANQLVAQNMCDRTLGPPLPPPGTLYFCNFGPGDNRVFIS